MFEVFLTGDKKLEKQLDNLVRQAPKKVLSSALRKSAKRVKTHIIDFINGNVLLVREGEYLRAWKKAKIKSTRQKRDRVRLGIEFPTREQLGISPSEKWFYPAALEYGSIKMRARPHIRPAVDNYRAQEYAAIARDVKAGIEKEALKKK